MTHIPDAAPGAKTSFWKNQNSRKLTAISSAIALVVGILCGASSTSASRETEVQDLTSALGFASSKTTSLQGDLDQAEALYAAALDEVEALESETETLRTQIAALEDEVESLEAAAKKKSTDASKSQSSPGGSSTGSSGSVYFKNCDAARAAGAAPVRRGDPGYGTHLDRDGDGVGCE